jgi:outer membrane immunogenic protein
MKRSVIAALGLLAAATAASAADLPRGSVPYRAPAYVAAYNWTGFYLGLNGGGAWGSSDASALPISVSPSGGMFGLTAGYNWQGTGSPWVFGLEGDIDWSSISDSTACFVGFTCESKTSWFGTARGRVGYAWDRIMPYVTGGAAFGNIEANVTGFPGVDDATVGWTVGGGVEAAIAGNWTAKVEYLYADIGDVGCTLAACGAVTNVDMRLNVLRGGVNYRF